MFSGIIEEEAKVINLRKEQENLYITMECSFTSELKPGHSIAHNGVCLTVLEKDDTSYTIVAGKETILKSNLGLLKTGDKINLERSMKLNDRLDGHLVQGHVDQTVVCTDVAEAGGSWYFSFSYNPTQTDFTVEKGSVCVNGISFTVVNSKNNTFQVAVFPYTYQHTNFKELKQGSVVNLEFDIIGKYVVRLLEQSERI